MNSAMPMQSGSRPHGRLDAPHRRDGTHSPWTHSPHLRHPSVVEDDVLRELGDRIRKARQARGLTQEGLAIKAGVDRSYVGGVERGQRNVTFTMLCKLCAALQCDVAELTRGIPQPLQ